MKLSTKMVRKQALETEAANETKMKEFQEVLDDPNAPEEVKEKVRRILKAVKKAHEEDLPAKNGEKKEAS